MCLNKGDKKHLCKEFKIEATFWGIRVKLCWDHRDQTAGPSSSDLYPSLSPEPKAATYVLTVHKKKLEHFLNIISWGALLLLPLIPARSFQHPHEWFWYDLISWLCWTGLLWRPAFRQIMACKIGVSSLQSEPRSNYMANLGVYYFWVNGNKALSLTGDRTPPTWQRECETDGKEEREKKRNGGHDWNEKRTTWWWKTNMRLGGGLLGMWCEQGHSAKRYWTRHLINTQNAREAHM